MADREKVIKGLEHCGQPTECVGCPYDSLTGGCFTKLKADALELLKEHEPVKWSNKYFCYVCNNCGVNIKNEVSFLMDKEIKYCPHCGRAVKWDG